MFVENLYSADRLGRGPRGIPESKPALAARKKSTSSKAFADDFNDVIAIDTLKRADLVSDPRGLSVRQDHWTQALGTGMGLNCYAAWVKQDC
jgi:hypothetical protein